MPLLTSSLLGDNTSSLRELMSIQITHREVLCPCHVPSTLSLLIINLSGNMSNIPQGLDFVIHDKNTGTAPVWQEIVVASCLVCERGRDTLF